MDLTSDGEGKLQNAEEHMQFYVIYIKLENLPIMY